MTLISWGRGTQSDLFGRMKPAAAIEIANAIDQAITIISSKEGEFLRLDTSPLWADPEAFQIAIAAFTLLLPREDTFDKIVGIESSGWIYAAALADRLEKPLVAARKMGDYNMGINPGNIVENDRVVIIDDLIISGSRAWETASSVEDLGGKVIRVIALADLLDENGKDFLQKRGYQTLTAISYPEL